MNNLLEKAQSITPGTQRKDAFWIKDKEHLSLAMAYILGVINLKQLCYGLGAVSRNSNLLYGIPVMLRWGIEQGLIEIKYKNENS